MLRILVIDDSPSALQITGAILAEAGYEARTFSDAKRALEVLESEPFDAIVTDIYMPDMDGLEVIREEHRVRPDIPIVAVSGIIGPRSMLGIARHLGACQTVQKPFSKAILLAAIEAALAVPCPGRRDSSGRPPVPASAPGRRVSPTEISRRRPAGNLDYRNDAIQPNRNLRNFR